MKLKLGSLPLLVLLIASILTGCQAQPSLEEEAASLLLSLKKAQYESSYSQLADGHYEQLASSTEKGDAYFLAFQAISEKVKPFFHQKEYEKFFKNRVAGMTIEAVIREKCEIRVKDVRMDEFYQDETNGSYIGHYTLELQFLYGNGLPDQAVVKKGQITVSQVDGVWKLERDWDGYLKESDLP
ncbi:hypothetical protein [Brevibacillus centrosporus]|uniref:hypothetical protein n=1 Tax=Brevibacillus centrosporus TaxID=54910 RepID=UPI0037F5EBFC